MKDDIPSRRGTVAFWQQEIMACAKRNAVPMQAFTRFSRWYGGNVMDLIDPDASPNLEFEWQQALGNMVPFVTDTSIADMFFRAPRFSVRCPFGQERGVFTQGLARCETGLVNDQIQQVGYFRRARRRLLDARLGPFGVLKITYDRDVAVDFEAVEEQRAQANMENQNLIVLGPGTPGKPTMDAHEDQIHSVHIEAHEELYAQMQRGIIAVPKSVKRFLRKHIELHEAMRHTERPTETIRDASLVVRRVNPLSIAYDITVDDIADARWWSEDYLARKIDVMANENYDATARREVASVADRWMNGMIPMPRGIPTPGSFDTADELVRIYEVIDLVDNVVREFAEGSSLMLRERPYTMRSIQPSGPYSILMFRPDVFEAAGVPPPTTWVAEQAAATAIDTAITSAAIESCRARGAYNSSLINADTMEKMREAPTGSWVPVEGIGPEMDMAKAFSLVPEVQVPDQAFGALARLQAGIQQRSGLGAQKLLGGDRSDSATEAAIVAGASDALSEDQASVVDDASSYDGKMMVRIMRKTYPKSKVIETVGMQLGQWWPDFWADRDIVNDRGVEVVPGSSRRRNTAIDTKLTLELMNGMASLPAMSTMAGQTLLLEMARRVAEDQGINGLDYDAIIAEMQMQQAMAGGGGPGGAEGDGEEAEETGSASQEEDAGEGARESEMTEPSAAGQLQAAANVGGGRMATGASRGDRTRFLRSVG